ncbi:MAG: exodeoxyribonuclease VII large subunit [Janthinobacterium lividum]
MSDTTGSARANEAIGLREYLDGIGRAVAAQPSAWVRCDLHKLDVTAKFVRMELIAPDDNSRHRAQTSGGCFPDAFSRMRRAFDETGLTLETGTKILVRLSAKVDANYGFKVEVLDIDPTYTLGDLRTRMQAIRVKLEASGEWGRNKSMRQPRDFVRVAVISPSGAAGLGDFRATAERLASRDLVAFDYFEAPFQSAEAAVRITDALRKIYPRAKAGLYCAIAIIRGGGAASDLTWLVDHGLVRATCLMPVPVIVGIGHERDRTLLDEVACVACHTPSLVAEHIRSTVTNAAIGAHEAMQGIRSQIGIDLSHLQAETIRLGSTTRSSAANQVNQAASALADLHHGIATGRTAAIVRADRSLAIVRADIQTASMAATVDAERAVAVAFADVNSAPSPILVGAIAEVRRIALSARGDARQSLARLASSTETAQEASTMAAIAELDRATQLVAESGRKVTAATSTGLGSVAPGAVLALAIQNAERSIASAATGVAVARSTADANDPAFVIQSGYAILRGPDGKPLTSSRDVIAAIRVTADMKDGSVTLTPTKEGTP